MRSQNLRFVEKLFGLFAILLFVVFSSIVLAQQEETEESDASEGQVIETQTSESDTSDSQESESDTSDSQEIESQLEQLKTSLYCPCGCDRMTFEICHCETAEQFKVDFRNALTEGETVEDIIAVYLETYGPQFSAVMKVEGINILAYTMPAVILIVIGGVIYMVRRQSREYKTIPPQDDNQISDELQQKIESELDQYKDKN